MIAAYAYNDNTAEVWYAPAGLNRGHLSTPLKADYNPTKGEHDLLYGDGNAVNPIATFKQDGLNIWGQRTLKRTPSALDRVNVRRLLLYLEKVLATATRSLVFEPNDSSTWLSFRNLVTPLLDSVKTRRGITEFKVVCDATVNTPDVIERNEMKAMIYIKPTKTAEFIQLNFIVTSQNSSFEELVF
jgi:phage tail sheath protein FI